MVDKTMLENPRNTTNLLVNPQVPQSGKTITVQRTMHNPLWRLKSGSCPLEIQIQIPKKNVHHFKFVNIISEEEQ